MADLPLATPTVGQTYTVNGQQYVARSLSGHVVADAYSDTVAGGISDAQRAQLIWSRGIPDGTTGTVATGTWLRVTEGSTFAYRLILSATGMSVYSLTQPT